jgi:hypothetical protein
MERNFKEFFNKFQVCKIVTLLNQRYMLVFNNTLHLKTFTCFTFNLITCVVHKLMSFSQK